jgi:signal transduction histidine kinase
VLLNLIGNAIKYTMQGFVSIKCTYSNTLCVAESDVTLEFEIKDTGLGIETEHIDKLFKLFTRIQIVDGVN